MRPTVIVFDPSGTYLLIGLTSGQIKVLKADTLEDACFLTPSTIPVTHIAFSLSGCYLSCADEEGRVIIFNRYRHWFASVNVLNTNGILSVSDTSTVSKNLSRRRKNMSEPKITLLQSILVLVGAKHILDPFVTYCSVGVMILKY